MMNHPRQAASLALALLASSGLALGEELRREGRDTAFIGVFYPTVTGAVVDAHRCPEPSHPILLSFTGTAQTTLGRAQFTQSHCEDNAHTSFRRGLQTVTFENGTQLFGSYQGHLLATRTTGVDGKLIVSGQYRNTGGTGGLSHADGRGISAGVVDTGTGAAVITVSGEL